MLVIEKQERFACLGDLHGEIQQLQDLLDILDDQYPGIEIFSVGDLIDRGSDSKGCIELCIKRNIKAIRGNHDSELIEAIKGSQKHFSNHCYEGMGGAATIRSYGIKTYNWSSYQDYMDAIPQSHKDYLLSMPFYKFIETPPMSYLITHAGISSYAFEEYLDSEWADEADSYQQIEDVLDRYQNDHQWGHKTGGFANLGPNTQQINGHRPIENVGLKEGTNWQIDSGAGKGSYPLTCFIFPDNKMIQVDKK